MEVKISIK